MKRTSPYIGATLRILSETNKFHCNVINYFRAIGGFLKDFINYAMKNDNKNYTVSIKYVYPCLRDKTIYTPVEPTYFYQDTWAASEIFHLMPTHHYDVGSSIMTLGIISQFIPTTLVDIRPIEVELDNLYFMKGSILALPFENDSLESLSSLCVVEHIGLGRYGDPIDPWGSEKAIKELQRVLKPGGNLLFSVPVDEENRIYFNAHRAFTREYVVDLFHDMLLVDEKYIYGRTMQGSYDKTKGFGTGLYHFKKR